MQTGTEIKQGENVFVKVRDWLSNARNGWWLMVLDNADDIDFLFEPYTAGSNVAGDLAKQDTRPLIEFIPQAAHGKILATSRLRSAVFRLVNDSNKVIKVDSMTEAESYKLLRSRIPGSPVEDVSNWDESRLLALLDGSPGEEVSAWDESRLLALLNHVPLAISQAGAYIANNESSIDEYVKEFISNEVRMENKPTLQILQQDSGDLRREQKIPEELMNEEGKKPHAVVNTWRISFRVIQKRHPHSAKLLAFISFYHHQAIPQYLIQGDWDGSAFEAVLSPLIDFAFVTRAVNKEITLHRLVQLVTRDWLKHEHTLEQYRLDALTEMVRHFPYGSYDDLPKCRQLYKHAEEVMISQWDFVKCGLDYGNLQDRLAEYFMTRGNLAMALGHAQNAVKRKLRAVDAEDVAVLESKLLEARVVSANGDSPGAFAIEDEIRSVIFAHKTEERYLRLMPRFGLQFASDLLHLEWLDFAEQVAVLTRQSAYKVYKDPTNIVRRADEIIAGINMHRGRWGAAEETYLRIMAEEDFESAGDNPHRFITRIDLAQIYAETDRKEEAEKLLKEAQEGLERLLQSKSHRHVLAAASNRAMVLKDLGRSDEAHSLCLEVLERSKRSLPSFHHTVVSLKIMLSTCLQEEKKWDEAERLLREAIEARDDTLFSHHISSIYARTHLAILFINKGEQKEAEKQLRALLTKENEEHWATDARYISTRENLAIAVMNQGKFRKAIKMEKEVEKAYRDKLGPNHRRTKNAHESWKRWQECYDTELGPWYRFPWKAEEIPGIRRLARDRRGETNIASALWQTIPGATAAAVDLGSARSSSLVFRGS